VFLESVGATKAEESADLLRDNLPDVSLTTFLPTYSFLIKDNGLEQLEDTKKQQFKDLFEKPVKLVIEIHLL
jgi:hypothetical protein